MTNYNLCNYAGWYAMAASGVYDQADGSWDYNGANHLYLTDFGRWVGVNNDYLGILIQAGEASGGPYGKGAFYEIYGGDCSTGLQVWLAQPLYYLYSGDRLYSHVIIADDTHWRIYMQDQTPGHTWTFDTGLRYCAYAYEYRGGKAFFGDERPYELDSNGTCVIAKLSAHPDNDMLSPRVHSWGEPGSTYHYVSTQNPTFTQMYDDQEQFPGAAWHLEDVGSLGSNSNFLLDFKSNGTVLSPVTGCGQ